MDYQTFRPMTRPPKPRKTFTRSKFAEHNYNYTHPPRAHHPHEKPIIIMYVLTIGINQ